MQLEAKIVWTDGDMPRWELFIEGNSQGKFATITEAADLLTDRFMRLVQAVVTS
jgi:hypothetical protein